LPVRRPVTAHGSNSRAAAARIVMTAGTRMVAVASVVDIATPTPRSTGGGSTGGGGSGTSRNGGRAYSGARAGVHCGAHRSQWSAATARGGTTGGRNQSPPRLSRRSRFGLDRARLSTHTVCRPAIAPPEHGSGGPGKSGDEAPVEVDAGGLAVAWENVRESQSWEDEEEDKVAEVLAEMAGAAKSITDTINAEGTDGDREGAAAIKAKAATYASLTDIVLDFNPDVTVAEKLLLIGAYFQSSPAEVAARLAEVTAVAARLYAVWTWEDRTGVPAEKRTRATQLREGIASLGPVFVKMAQTLSTRPDVIGTEAATSLTVLQDQMSPFSSEDAYNNIRDELNYQGPIAPGDKTWTGADVRPLYKTLSELPVAAASIGQVYKGQLWDGSDVAVKVQRPGVLRQIALDLHIARMGLQWLEESGLNGATDLPNIVDRVGSGIFQELDYRLEAQNADDFRRSLRFMDFLFVPRHFADKTGQRVLTQEWIYGRPMKALTDAEQFRMVQMGVECSSAQLFRTGLVHADPHEGNMLYTDDGKLALLDFGLICRVNNAQQEAMAGCILNVLNRDWMELIDNLRIIEMLPEVPQTWVNTKTGVKADYTDRGEGGWEDVDDSTFREAFRVCLDGDDPAKKLTNFTELVVDLTKLSTAWRFNLPPYMVFIIRSLTTLDFCAVRTGANMYELAAPTALFRAMAPKTARGRAQLEKTLIAADGNVNWKKLIALTESAGGDVGGKAGAGAGARASAGGGAGVAGIEGQVGATGARAGAASVGDVDAATAGVATTMATAAAPALISSNPSEGAAGTGAEAAGAAAVDGVAARAAMAPGAMDKHMQESVNRLVQELVGSSSGSALRRILVRARPESLVPPAAVRATIVRAARASFARSVAALSPRQMASLVFKAVKRVFAGIFGGRRRGKAGAGGRPNPKP